MKTLLSFTKLTPSLPQLDKPNIDTGTGPEPGMENGNMEEPMEDDVELVIDTAGASETEGKGPDTMATGAETETETEEGVEPENLTAATLELVDQMEIEISDHEGGGGGGGGEGGGGESGGEEKSKKPLQQTAVRAVKRETGGVGKEDPKPQHKRRRHSSTIDKISFPPISLDRQLSDDDVIDLMNLLHVCCALKVQAQMYLKDEEAAVILSPIASSCPPFSPAGVQFVKVALCILLACPFLIRSVC